MSMGPRKAFRTGLKRTSRLWQEGMDDEVFNWFVASGVDTMMAIHCAREDESHLCARTKARMLRWQYAERRDRFVVDLGKVRLTLLADHWMKYDAWCAQMAAQMARQRDEDWNEYLKRRQDERRVLVLMSIDRL